MEIFADENILSLYRDCSHLESLRIPEASDSLIIVPGHALLRSTTVIDSNFNPTDISFWSLNEFQSADELSLILGHIRTGVSKLFEIPTSVLCFSGACTRHDGIGWTEGLSYYAVARHCCWWVDSTDLSLSDVDSRVFVDAYALDSFGNMWIPIYSFYLVHPKHVFPLRVIVVNYEFKRALYERHAQFLNVPHFEYIGLANPHNLDLCRVQEKISHLIRAYEADPYGENPGSEIYCKLQQRNVLHISYPYGSSRELVEYCRSSYAQSARSV